MTAEQEHKLFEGTTQTPADEEIECPLCNVTPIQALASKNKPCVLVRLHWAVCPCYKDGKVEFHIPTEQAKLEGREHIDPRTIEARQCFYEEMHKPHEPGSESKGKTRTRESGGGSARGEQDWHGFAEEDESETERQEYLTKPIEGKVPRVLKDRLKKEAKDLGTSMNRVFRHLLSKHLLNLAEGWDVEYGGDNVMLRVHVTPDWFQLWQAKKVQLSDHEPAISDADMLAAVMFKEWA